MSIDGTGARDPLLDPEHSSWAAAAVEAEARVVDARRLRVSGPPWLLTVQRADGSRVDVVLRVGHDPVELRAERDAQLFATANGVAAPHVIASRIGTQVSLLLIGASTGSSVVPRDRPVERLRRSGALAAQLASIPAPEALPRRTRPISGVDFAALRAQAPPHPLLARAEQVVREFALPPGPECFVHGDLWQGNLLWHGDELVAVLDWDCAGRGPVGLDLGSFRLDAALDFGLAAADDVLDGWREAGAAEPAALHYWDAVAALASPNDMGWFVEAAHEQGREDLTRELLIARRDEFLERSLGALAP